MPGVFISYRRDDSAGFAGRLADDLSETFGPELVFMDVTGIEPGIDFRKAIEQKVGDCDALLVVIGKEWIGSRGGGGAARLQDTADFVRLEVAAALRREIPVIPVLVNGAAMPSARDLPADVEQLAWRNAVELRHARWDADVQVLQTALDKLLPQRAATRPVPDRTEAPPVPADVEPAEGNRRFPWRTVAAAALLVIMAGLTLVVVRQWRSDQGSGDPTGTGSRGTNGQRGGGPYPATLPAGADVTVSTARYQILSATLERGGGEYVTLRFAVRMTNMKPFPDNFWAESFRLLVDDAAMAPTGMRDEVVQGYSANDGEVTFQIAPATTSATLQVINGGESTRIPIDLKAAVPGAPPAPPRTRRAGPFPMTVVTGGDVRAGEITYRFVSAAIVRRDPEQLALRLTVRATNHRPAPANFWDASFRLEVDGVPRAPLGGLNETLAGNSARQGEVVFVFPDTVGTLALLVGDGNGKTRVPLTLRR